MDRGISEALAQAAACYNYPKTLLTYDPSASLPHFVALGFAVSAGDRTHLSYPAFEQEIGDQLRSQDPARARLGLASVVYWGHLSRNHGIAAIQAAKAIEANAGILSRVAAHVDQGRLGDALVLTGELPAIGSTSFGSKVIAFLAPEAAGVFDEQIYEYLARCVSGLETRAEARWIGRSTARDAWPAFGQLTKRKKHARIASGYAGWCSFLSETAAELTRSEAPAPHGLLAWRAVDVERAIFHLASRVARTA
jgi:hypothetical protein